MLRDKATVTYYAAPGKHGCIHHEKFAARGERMPVVMVLGGHPMTFILPIAKSPTVSVSSMLSMAFAAVR